MFREQNPFKFSSDMWIKSFDMQLSQHNDKCKVLACLWHCFVFKYAVPTTYHTAVGMVCEISLATIFLWWNTKIKKMFKNIIKLTSNILYILSIPHKCFSMLRREENRQERQPFWNNWSYTIWIWDEYMIKCLKRPEYNKKFPFKYTFIYSEVFRYFCAKNKILINAWKWRQRLK